MKKSKIIEECLGDMHELQNNLLDDLEMDPSGENGVKTHVEVVQAIRKHTYRVLLKKIDKWKGVKKNEISTT